MTGHIYLSSDEGLRDFSDIQEGETTHKYLSSGVDVIFQTDSEEEELEQMRSSSCDLDCAIQPL